MRRLSWAARHWLPAALCDTLVAEIPVREIQMKTTEIFIVLSVFAMPASASPEPSDWSASVRPGPESECIAGINAALSARGPIRCDASTVNSNAPVALIIDFSSIASLNGNGSMPLIDCLGEGIRRAFAAHCPMSADIVVDFAPQPFQSAADAPEEQRHDVYDPAVSLRPILERRALAAAAAANIEELNEATTELDKIGAGSSDFTVRLAAARTKSGKALLAKAVKLTRLGLLQDANHALMTAETLGVKPSDETVAALSSARRAAAESLVSKAISLARGGDLSAAKELALEARDLGVEAEKNPAYLREIRRLEQSFLWSQAGSRAIEALRLFPTPPPSLTPDQCILVDTFPLSRRWKCDRYIGDSLFLYVLNVDGQRARLHVQWQEPDREACFAVAAKRLEATPLNMRQTDRTFPGVSTRQTFGIGSINYVVNWMKFSSEKRATCQVTARDCSVSRDTGPDRQTCE